MTQPDSFELSEFLPYLLNIAAETASVEFQVTYKQKYGLLRTDWRVLFHLGLYGQMTAKDICTRARLHKTKVSRAVSRLEQRRFLSRQEKVNDRRFEALSLTNAGYQVFRDLQNSARQFDERIERQLSHSDLKVFRKCLRQFAGFRENENFTKSSDPN